MLSTLLARYRCRDIGAPKISLVNEVQCGTGTEWRGLIGQQLLLVVADHSRVFHAVVSAVLQDIDMCTPVSWRTLTNASNDKLRISAVEGVGLLLLMLFWVHRTLIDGFLCGFAGDCLNNNEIVLHKTRQFKDWTRTRVPFCYLVLIQPVLRPSYGKDKSSCNHLPSQASIKDLAGLFHWDELQQAGAGTYYGVLHK